MREQRLSWIEETKKRDKISRAGSPGDKSPRADTTGGEAEPQRDDDELYSLPQPRTVITDGSGGSRAGSSGALFLSRGDDTSDEDFGPNDDELDALMDVETAMGSAGASVSSAAVQGRNVDKSTIAATPQADDFEDEMEAMTGFGPPDW